MHNAQLHNGQEKMLHKISQILSFVVGGEIALKIAIFRILCLCVGGWRGELRRFRGTVALSTYLPFWSVEIFAKCDAATRAGWGLPGHWNMPKTTLAHPWFRCTRVPKTILHIHGFVVLECQKHPLQMVSLFVLCPSKQTAKQFSFEQCIIVLCIVLLFITIQCIVHRATVSDGVEGAHLKLPIRGIYVYFPQDSFTYIFSSFLQLFFFNLKTSILLIWTCFIPTRNLLCQP